MRGVGIGARSFDVVAPDALRARLADRPPHELYAMAARLDAQARRAQSAVGARQAARWEALADAIVAP